MIPRDALLARAVPQPVPVDDAKRQKLARQLGPRKLVVPGSPRGAVRYPGGKNIAAAAERLLAAGNDLGDGGVQLVFDALTQPLRAYELRSASDDVRLLVLLMSWVPPDAEMPSVLIGRLTVPADGRNWSLAELQVTVVSGGDPHLDDMLESVVRSTVREQRAQPDPDIPNPRDLLWIGGSADEHGVSDWVERVDAAATVRGFRARVIEQPARRFAETLKSVDGHGRNVVVMWMPYTGPGAASFQAACLRTPILLHAATLDGALEELREELDAVLDESDESDATSDTDRVAPESGEVRYYKKHFARRGGGDKMLNWHDCGHGNWTNATYAPQAELGVRKLEAYEADFVLQKCKACTGGGVWRVRY